MTYRLFVNMNINPTAPQEFGPYYELEDALERVSTLNKALVTRIEGDDHFILGHKAIMDLLGERGSKPNDRPKVQ